METKDYLTNYYERYDEEGRLISKHGMVEYITTMKYIEKYLKPNMRVLEIGAATGRYSHALAQKGHRVDAVELVEHNIEIFKQNTIVGEPVTITQGNAMDLSDFRSITSSKNVCSTQKHSTPFQIRGTYSSYIERKILISSVQSSMLLNFISLLLTATQIV